MVRRLAMQAIVVNVVLVKIDNCHDTISNCDRKQHRMIQKRHQWVLAIAVGMSVGHRLWR